MKKINRNIILSVLLLAGIAFSVVTIVMATAPDPGHNFTEASGGVVQGNLLYGSAADTLLALPKDTNATRYLSNTGGGVNNPAWAQVDLTNGVTSILPGANGGTGIANTSKTITLGGNLTTAGAFNTTLTVTADSNATLPAGTKTLLAQDGSISNLTGTINSTVLGNSTVYIGTTGVLLNRGSGALSLTGVNIDGSAATVTGATQTSITSVANLVTVGALTAGSIGTGFVVKGVTMTLGSDANYDTYYRNASGVLTRLAPGATTGAVLMNTAAGAPSWSLLSALPSTAGALPVVNGGTGLTAAVSDAVLIGDSTTGYTARTLPASCAGTTAKLLYDSTTNLFSCGTDQTAAGTATQFNQSVANQGAGFAADTYLTGSSITIPASSLKVGSRYHLIFNVSKTAAGTATPIINVRLGTGGSTADSSKCALTFTAQTAATDTGSFEVWVTFRTVGSGTSAVVQCASQRRHGASITGFGTLVAETKVATSAGFDSTVANSIIGVSVNGGTSAAWTVTLVQAELSNLQ